MKNMTRTASLVVALLALGVVSTPAVPYQLASVPKATVGDMGDGTIQAWLKGLIDAYNTANDPDLPGRDDIAAVPDLKVNVGPDIKSMTLGVSEYDYLVLHWGGNKGGYVEAYWLGDCPDGSTHVFNTPPDMGGLSFYSYYNSDPDDTLPPSGLPDSGTTLALLGAVCTGLAAFGRRAPRLS